MKRAFYLLVIVFCTHALAETGTVTDIDGNTYVTVKIGNQWWMAENLKVTHYRNGESISHITDDSEWASLTSGAYCAHENDENYVDTYGRFYNWYAFTDDRNIAPEGWHVPSDEEWKELEMYLGMSQSDADGTGWRGTYEGGKLKESGFVHWNSPNLGATNSSGFTALPTGYRNYDGLFHHIGNRNYYWTSDELNNIDVWTRALNKDNAGVFRVYGYKTHGYSIRCVKDDPSAQTDNKIFWTECYYQNIKCANIDGSDVTTLISGIGEPYGLVLDESNGFMYWVNQTKGKIQRSNLEGGNIVDIVTGLQVPDQIEIDFESGIIYWSDPMNGLIQFAGLDGSDQGTLFSGLSMPGPLKIDTVNDKLYWIEKGSDELKRCCLDGQNVEVLISSGLQDASFFTLDILNNKMYICDRGIDQILTADLDGSNLIPIIGDNLISPRGIVINNIDDMIYFADEATLIQRADFNGENRENVVTSGIQYPYCIALLKTHINISPLAILPESYIGYEGSAISFVGGESYDPDGCIVDYAWDIDGDGEFDDATDEFASYTWGDDYSGTIGLQVTDNDGAAANSTSEVIVENVNPSVGLISASLDPIQIGTSIPVSASFTDQGVFDTHTAEWDWGDGNTSDGTVTEENGAGTIEDSHVYETPGVHTVTLTVTDDDGGVGESVFEYVVVYDPSAGFVTGGGWINSPAGSYAADLSLSGKANFGFVSKYQKGAAVPTGNTEFQFKVADLNFHSSCYEWLVIAGTKAKYKGTGTINGSGNFGFMINGIDCEDEDTDDKFRMKIWDKDNGDAVVYDNQMDDADDGDATCALGGGNIKIHSTAESSSGEFASGDRPDIKAIPDVFEFHQNYPNPFNPETTIEYSLPEDAHVTITIYNILGDRIITLVDDQMNAGYKSVQWSGNDELGRLVGGGFYLCKIRAGTYHNVIRMLLMK